MVLVEAFGEAVRGLPGGGCPRTGGCRRRQQAGSAYPPCQGLRGRPRLSGVLTLVYTVLAVLETLRGEEVERHAVSLDRRQAPVAGHGPWTSPPL